MIPSDITGQDARDRLVDTVNCAIGHVVSGAPTLQVGILGEKSSKPVWIKLETVDLNEHLKWTTLDGSTNSEHSVQAAVASQLDTRFFKLDVRPGWRVLVMNHTTLDILDILFVWNHPHADGMSGKIFHQLLLEELNKVTKNGVEENTNGLVLKFPDSPKAFPPATESLVRLPVTPRFVLKEAWNDYKPPSLFPRKIEASWAPIRTSHYKTQFRSFVIPNGILSKVVTICHDQKTTLTALLNGLALVSLASHIDEAKAPVFASSTAIDQRRFLPSHPPAYPWFDGKKTIANYVSIMTHQFDSDVVAEIRSKLGNDSRRGELSEAVLNLLWSTSARVRSEIANRLEIGLQNDVVGLMKFVPNWKKQFRRDVKKPRKLSWFVTNLGVFEGEHEAYETQPSRPQQSWSIRRAQFTLSTEIPVAALLIGVASVQNESLVITCTWQDTVVEQSLVESLMADMERWLTQIGSQ
jgi:hypothetical protein